MGRRGGHPAAGGGHPREGDHLGAHENLLKIPPKGGESVLVSCRSCLRLKNPAAGGGPTPGHRRGRSLRIFASLSFDLLFPLHSDLLLVLDTFFFGFRGRGRGTHRRGPTRHCSISGTEACGKGRITNLESPRPGRNLFRLSFINFHGEELIIFPREKESTLMLLVSRSGANW